MSERIVYYTRAKLEEIREAVKEGDWFTAMVLSATELERFGCERIQDYLKSGKIKSEIASRILESFYLRDVAECLLMMKTINKEEYKEIMEINEHRNKFIHRREKRKILYGKEAREKYEPLAKEALRILKEKLCVVVAFVGRA
jgi:hypothetical protein